MQLIGEYAKAVGRHWVALLGGSLVTIYQAIVPILPGDEQADWWKRPMPVWLNVLLLLVGLAIAQYLAWLEMRRERDAHIKKIDSLQEEAREKKREPSQDTPTIVGDLVVEHMETAFRPVLGRYRHIRLYIVRMSQRAEELLFLCEGSLIEALCQVPESSMEKLPKTAAKLPADNCALIEFPDPDGVLGSVLYVELISARPVRVTKIAAS
jgi:hypothetical protein